MHSTRCLNAVNLSTYLERHLMLGTVKTFNAQTGCATIQCDALDTEIALCVADIPGAKQKLHIGDLLQFQCDPNQGRPQITSFVLIARAGPVPRTQPTARSQHANPAPKATSTPIADTAAGSQRTPPAARRRLTKRRSCTEDILGSDCRFCSWQP